MPTKHIAGISFTLTLACKQNNEPVGSRVAQHSRCCDVIKTDHCIGTKIGESLRILVLCKGVPFCKCHINSKVRAYDTGGLMAEWMKGKHSKVSRDNRLPQETHSVGQAEGWK